MKIDYEYAYQLLKKLENIYPDGMLFPYVWPHACLPQETQEDFQKRKAHLVFLLDEKLLCENPPRPQENRPFETYRISSKAISLLAGKDFPDWVKTRIEKN